MLNISWMGKPTSDSTGGGKGDCVSTKEKSGCSSKSVKIKLEMKLCGFKELSERAAVLGIAEYLKPIQKDGEVLLEIECGPNKAQLYLSRLCQGSKGPCIEFQGSWLTPNEFQFVSGRESAKDWKRSIRHLGKSLKLLFSKGLLNVHPTACDCDGCNANPIGKSRLFEKRRLSLVEKNKVSTVGVASSSVTEEHTNTDIADDQIELRSVEEIPVAVTQETLAKKQIDVSTEATNPPTEQNSENDISSRMIENMKSMKPDLNADSQYPVLDVVSIEKDDQTSASLSETNFSAKDSCVLQINPTKCSAEEPLEKNIIVTTEIKTSPVHCRSPILSDVKRKHNSTNDRKSPPLDLGQPQRSSTPIVQKPTATRCSDSGDRIGRRDTRVVTPGQELREEDTGVLPVSNCGDCQKELSPPRYPDFGYPYYNQYLRMMSSTPRVPLQLGSVDPCFHLRHRELSTYQGYVPPIPHSFGYGTPSVPTYSKDMCSSFCTPAAFLPTMPYYPPFCMLPPTIGLQCPPPYQLPHDVLSQYVRSEATYEHDFIPPPSAFMSELKRSASKMDDCVDLSSKRFKMNTVV